MVSVITRISVDHMDFLGNDISGIAGEKSGIIKRGRPVVAGLMDDIALDIVRRRAREMDASIHYASENVSIVLNFRNIMGQKIVVDSSSCSYGTLHLPLAGDHQLENLATAITAIEAVADELGIDVSPDAVKTGIARTVWPGRFQLLNEDPPLIIDAAHNPASASVLSSTLASVLDNRPLGLILGMCKDKDINGFLHELGSIVSRFWAVPVDNPRSACPASLVEAGKILGWPASESSLDEAVVEALRWAQENDGVICVTGSLFLIGELLGDSKWMNILKC